jgi:hypothetical protein
LHKAQLLLHFSLLQARQIGYHTPNKRSFGELRMLRTGRRWIGVAAVAALAAGHSAAAADMAGTAPLAVAAAANSAAAQSQILQGPHSITQNAMDLMRAGRAADALDLLEPVAAHFARRRGQGLLRA